MGQIIYFPARPKENRPQNKKRNNTKGPVAFFRAHAFVEGIEKLDATEKNLFPALLDALAVEASRNKPKSPKENSLAEEWSVAMVAWIVSFWSRTGQVWAKDKEAENILFQMWTAKLRMRTESRLNEIASQSIKSFTTDLAKQDSARAFAFNYAALRRVEACEAKGGLSSMEEEKTFGFDRLLESWDHLRLAKPQEALFASQALFRRVGNLPNYKDMVFLIWQDLAEDLYAQGQADLVLAHLQKLSEIPGLPANVARAIEKSYEEKRPKQMTFDTIWKTKQVLRLVFSKRSQNNRLAPGPFAPKEG